MKHNKEQTFVKIIFLILFILTLLNTNYSCNPLYDVTIPIRVVDNNYRPIEGASVSIYHQISSSVIKNGKPEYEYTPEYKTNRSGRVDIEILNQEYNPDKVDCNIKIRVKLYNYTKEVVVDLDTMLKMNLIKIPVDLVEFKIMDQNLRPLEGRVILDHEYSFNVNGSLILQIPEGEHNVLMIHKGNKRSYEIEVDKDMTLSSIFEYKIITFNVLDEKGVPLPFKLEIEGKEYNSTGELTINMPSGTTTAKIKSQGETKVLNIDTEKKQYYVVFIDKSAPKLYNLDINEEDNKTEITIIAADEGEHASGIKKVYGKITYEDDTLIEKEFNEKEGETYTLEIDKTGSFSFVITLYDKEGNMLTLKGKHNVTYNNKNPDIEKSQDLFPIIIAVIIIGLIGGAIYIRKKLKEMEEI